LKQLVTLICLVLPLAGAAAAEAKGRAQVCGASGCTTLTDPADAGNLRSTFEPTRAPKPAPFYVVRFCSRWNCRGPSEWSYLYVPSATAMRADNFGSGPVRWMQASVLSSLLTELTKDIDPYPASPTWTPVATTQARATVDSVSISWIAVAVLAATIALMR
jgi:hypothetical protein